MSEDTNKKMAFGSLFAGIGGIDLGLECSGMECKWQVENDAYCTKILEKHWPEVKRYGDIREIKEGELESVELICGGFPCQPVSHAGKRKGTEDERWLWPEFYRIIRVVGPEWVLVENVPGLLSIDSGKVFGGILRDLAECGYDAEWRVYDARFFGVPQRRRRLYIIGHRRIHGTIRVLPITKDASMVNGGNGAKGIRPSHFYTLPLRAASTKHGTLPILIGPCKNPSTCINGQGMRTTDGFSRQLDIMRYKSLGNAVVPQVAEYMGHQILRVSERCSKQEEDGYG